VVVTPNLYHMDLMDYQVVFEEKKLIRLPQRTIGRRFRHRRLASCVAGVLAASSASAADWFDNAGAYMGRIEPWSDGSIWLSIAASSSGPANLPGRASSCTVTQIHLLPPTGQEKAWLAVVLSAATTGKAISVFGECVPSNTRIDATRLVSEY